MRHEGRTAAKKPGTLICGKWRVERTVRVNEQLASYVATDPSGARVYLKVLHPYKAGDAPLVARLKREAYVVNRIKHPAIVRVLGDGETDEGSVAIALELVEGDTLEEYRIKRGGLLQPDEVAKIGAQLCDALAAAHDQGVIHRDVRPESFMITKSGDIRVPEFAAARVLGEQVEERERTAAGTTLGSPSFMSPEQARGQRDRIDKRSDVFGLGATLYTLLSGKTVHPADNPLAALLAASRNRAKPVRTVVRGELPDVLANAVDKALAFEPTDRFFDMRAFKKALVGGDSPAGRSALGAGAAGGGGASGGPIARTQQSAQAPSTAVAATKASPSMSPPPPLRPASMPAPPLGQGLPQRGFQPSQGPLARPATSGAFSPKAPLAPQAQVQATQGSQASQFPPPLATQSSPQVAVAPVERKDSRPPKPELPRAAPDQEITALLQPGMVPAPMAPPMLQAGYPQQATGYGPPGQPSYGTQPSPQMGHPSGYPNAPQQSAMGGYGVPAQMQQQPPQQGSGGYPAQGPQGHPYGGAQVHYGHLPPGMQQPGMPQQGYGPAYGAPPQGQAQPQAQGYGASQSGGYAAQGNPGQMAYGANPGYPQGPGFGPSPSNPPPAFPGATPPMPAVAQSRTGLYAAIGGGAVLMILALVYAFVFMGR